VPLFSDGSDTPVSDGLVTVCAFRAAHFFVTSFASRRTVVFKEKSRSDGAAARAAGKVLGVVRRSERLYDFTINGLLASATYLFPARTGTPRLGGGEGRLYSGNVVHLAVEVVQERVELVWLAHTWCGTAKVL